MKNPGEVDCRKTYVSIAVATGILFNVFSAQGLLPVLDWVQRYSNPANADDYPVKIVSDSNGNAIVAGYSMTGVTGSDLVIIKYSATGMPLWTNRYNGPASGNDYPTDLGVDDVGNVFVTGSANFAGASQYVTIAISALGVPMWTNTFLFPGSFRGAATAICVDDVGNVIVTGNCSDAGYATIKYSSEGAPIWTNIYKGGVGPDIPTRVTTGDADEIFVTGCSWNENKYDLVTVKYSSGGLPLWTNHFAPISEQSFGGAAALVASGNVVVAGYSFNASVATVALLAYTPEGVPLWTNDFLMASDGLSRNPLLAAGPDQSVFVTALALTVGYSRSGVPLWTNYYNPTGLTPFTTSGLGVDTNGDVFVTGSAVSAGMIGFGTVKYSATGQTVWTNFYNGLGTSPSLALSPFGNALLLGGASDKSSSDFLTVALSNNGNVLWTNGYNGAGNSSDYAIAIAGDSSGRVVVTGFSMGAGTAFDYATVAYSSSGVPLWTNRYNGQSNGDDEASALAIDNLGNVIVTGFSAGDLGQKDFATIKYSPGGLPLWTNRFNGPGVGDGQAVDAAVDANGVVYVIGWSKAAKSFPGDADYVTLAYSPDGLPLWTNYYDGSGNDYAVGIALDRQGHVIVAGSSVYPFYSDYITVAYATNGDALWTNRYDFPGFFNDSPTDIGVDTKGRVFVTGSSYGPNNYDYATVAYTDEGQPLWTNRFNGSEMGDEFASAIAVDALGRVIVTGQSHGTNQIYCASVMYSGEGVPLWTNVYVGSGNTSVQGEAVGVDTHGTVVIVCQNLALMYSANGLPLWTNRDPADSLPAPRKRSLAMMSDGFALAYWDTGNSGGSSIDYGIVKYATDVLLSLAFKDNTLVFSWPAAFTGWRLEMQTNSTDSTWTTVPESATTNFISFSPGQGSPNSFFRLHSP